MSLAFGRQHLAIPGPSVMPDRVLQAMHRAAPNIYAGELVEMVPTILRDLKAVARTTGDVAIYICNGHGTWEASLSNVLSRGDKVLVLRTGRFADGWADCARRLGCEADIIDFGTRPVDPARVEEALRADGGHAYRAVLCVQVDTATSVLSDVPAIRRAMDAAGHPALLMADCIACLGVDRMEMDAWGVDVIITGSQKGLMTPPGLGFVFLSAKADAARERSDLATMYWDWRPRIRPAGFYEYFNGTAPTHHLFGLRAALDMIAEEGIENVWARHDVLASAVWAAVDRWAEGGALSPVVADHAARARAVTTIDFDRAEELRGWCERKAGLTLGIGLSRPGEAAVPQRFRIGHMGHLSAHSLLGTLGTVEAGLRAIGTPIGQGALDAAAEVIAARA